MSKLLKLILSPLIAAMAVSVVAGERVGDFALIDHQGAFHHMSWYDDHEAVVILAHANDAAGAQRALADLLALQGKYQEQGVVFFMLNPGLQSDRAVVQANALAMGIEFPALMDDSQLVSEMLGFTRLGEAVVYDPGNFEVFFVVLCMTHWSRCCNSCWQGRRWNWSKWPAPAPSSIMSARQPTPSSHTRRILHRSLRRTVPIATAPAA